MVEPRRDRDYTQFRQDIERCAARLNDRPLVGLYQSFDPMQLRALGEHLDKALADAKSNARGLIEEHQRDFPNSPLFSNCTLLGPIGQGRREVAVTQALAWLLDPRANHGFGPRLLHAFLSVISKDSEAGRIAASPAESISVHAEYAVTSSSRADILIKTDTAAVVVEAKIDASEGESQTERYVRDFRQLSDNPVFIYLTPDGRSADSPAFVALRFLEVARVLTRALRWAQEAEGFHYARYFVAGLLADLCGVSPCGDPRRVLANNSFHIEALLGGRPND